MASGDKFKKLESGDVIKFEMAGDSISGELIEIQESRMYPGSFAVKMKVSGKQNPQVVFVSNIVVDKLRVNNVSPGAEIMIEYQGKKKAVKSGMEYNDYNVYVA